MSRVGWERCRLCGTTENLEYCTMCRKYFCPTCKKKYPERVKAAMEEKTASLFDMLGNALGLGN